MSKQIEERVVSLSIDNSRFSSKAKESISILDKLKAALKLDGAGKGFDEIDKASQNLTSSITKNSKSASDGIKSMSKSFEESSKSVSKSVDGAVSSLDELNGSKVKGIFGTFTNTWNSFWDKLTGHSKKISSEVSDSFGNIQAAADDLNMDNATQSLLTFANGFTALETVAYGALVRIGGQITDTFTNTVKSLTLDPIMGGWGEYELGLSSTQTLVNTSGESLQEVERVLEDLNQYADKTIYTYSDMTANLPKFVNAALTLQESEDVMKGIFNASGYFGVGKQQASNAMYNIAQAYSTGYMDLMNWKSVELAGLGTTKFREEIIKTAEEMGVLQRESDDTWFLLEDGVVKSAVTVAGFRDTLQDKWLTNDIMTATLNKFSDTTTELGKRAEEATTEVIKLSQVFEVAAEDVGSSWADTWKIISGNYEESKAIYTEMSHALGAFLGSMNDARNTLLKQWKELGGRNDLIIGITNIWHAFLAIFNSISWGFTQVFGKLGPKDLKKFTEGFKQLTDILRPTVEWERKLERITEGVASALHIVWSVVKTAPIFLGPIVEILSFVVEIVSRVLVKISGVIRNIDLFLQRTKILETTAHNIVDFITALVHFSNFLAYDLFGISFDNAIVKAIETVQDIPNKISEAFEKLTGINLGDKLTSLKDSIMDLLTTRKYTGDYFTAIMKFYQGIKKGFTGTTNFFAGIINTVVTYLDTFSMSLIGIPFSEILSDIGDSLSEGVEAIKNFFLTLDYAKLGSDIATGLGTVGQFVLGAIVYITNAVRTLLGMATSDSEEKVSIFQKLGEKVREIFTTVADTLSPYVNGIKDFIGKALVTLWDGFQNMDVTKLSMLLTSILTGEIAVTISKFIDWISGCFKAFDDIKESIVGVFESIQGAIDAKALQFKADALMTLAKAIAILTAAIFVLTLLDEKKMEIAVGAIEAMLLTIMGIFKTIEATARTSAGLKIDKEGLDLAGSGGPYSGVASAFLALAVAIGVVVAGAAILSTYNLDQVAQGVIVMELLLGTMAAILKSLTTYTKTIGTDNVNMEFAPQETDKLKQAGFAMIELSFGAMLIAKGVAAMVKVGDPDTIKAAGLAMVGILGAMFAIIKFGMQVQEKEYKNADVTGTRVYEKTVSSFGDISKSLLALAVVTGAIGVAVSKMTASASSDPEAFDMAMRALLFTLGIFSLVMIALADMATKSENGDQTASIMDSFAKGLKSVLTSFVTITIAMSALALIGKLIAGDQAAYDFALITMAMFLGVTLTVMMMLSMLGQNVQNNDANKFSATIESFGNAMMKIGAAFSIMMLGLSLVILAIMSRKDMDPAYAIASLGIIIVAFAGFAGIVGVLANFAKDFSGKEAKGLIALGGSMILMSIAFAAMATAIAAIAAVTTLMGPGAIALAESFIGLFIVLLYMMGNLVSNPTFDSKKVLTFAASAAILGATIVAISSVIPMFAASMKLLSTIPAEEVKKTIILFAVGAFAAIVVLGVAWAMAMSILTKAMQFLPQIEAFILTIHQLGVGFLLIAAALAVFAISLTLIAAIGPNVTATIIALFTGFAMGIVTALTLFAENKDAMVTGVVALMTSIAMAIMLGWDPIREMLTFLLTGFLGFADDSFILVMQELGRLLIRTLEFVISFAQELLPYVHPLAEVAVEFIATLFKAIGDAVRDNADLIADAVWSMITAVFNVLLAFIGISEEDRGMLGEFFEDIWNKVFNFFEDFGKRIYDAHILETFFDTLNGIIADIWTSILNGVNEAFKIAKMVQETFIDPFIDSIEEFINDPLGGIQKLGENIVSGFTEGIQKAGDAIKEAGNWVHDLFAGTLESNDNFDINSPSVEMAEDGGYVGEGFVEGVKNTLPSIKKVGSDIFTNLKTGLSENGTLDKIKDLGTSLGSKAKDGFLDAVGINPDEMLGGLTGDGENGLDLANLMNSDALNTEGLSDVLGIGLGDSVGGIDTSAFSGNMSDLLGGAMNTGASGIDMSQFSSTIGDKFNTGVEGANYFSGASSMASGINTTINAAAKDIDTTPFKKSGEAIHDWYTNLKNGVFDDPRVGKIARRSQFWDMIDQIKMATEEGLKLDGADKAPFERTQKALKAFMEGYDLNLYEGADGLNIYRTNLRELRLAATEANKYAVEYAEKAKQDTSAALSNVGDLNTAIDNADSKIEYDSNGNAIQRYKLVVNDDEAKAQIASIMDMFNEQPVITPIIDLDAVRSGVEEANSLFFANGWQKTYDFSGMPASLMASGYNPDDPNKIARGDILTIMDRITEVKNEVATLGERIDNIDLVLDSGAIVGGIADPMDSALGQKAIQSGRERYSYA